MDKNNNSKRNNGQYFTTTNPFTLAPFIDWLKQIPNDVLQDATILEPFAGSNNIPAMIYKSGILSNSWACFDIEPPAINNCDTFAVKQCNTIKYFPSNYKIAITNPPYLGKNSASRRHLAFPDTVYDDLYKLCLDKMLAKVDYVAAIIPETFTVANLFTDRLWGIISLTCKMFDDTLCPVCLALFNKRPTSDFKLYRMNEYLGSFIELSKYIPKPTFSYSWKFNDPYGIIGIKCVDASKPTIRFCPGDEIDSASIKISSRSETKVTCGEIGPENLDIFLTECNKLLAEYRLKTKDVFMAAFKNLGSTGAYRRRLDFATAKLIMSKAIDNLGFNKNKEYYKINKLFDY